MSTQNSSARADDMIPHSHYRTQRTDLHSCPIFLAALHPCSAVIHAIPDPQISVFSSISHSRFSSMTQPAAVYCTLVFDQLTNLF